MFVVSRKLLDDRGLDDDDEFRKSLNLVKEWAARGCSLLAAPLAMLPPAPQLPPLKTVRL